MTLQSATDLILAILQRHETTSSSVYRATSGLQEAYIGVSDRWIVTLKEITAGVIRVAMRDIETRRNKQLVSEVHAETELRATIEAWADKIAWWSTRLTVYRLQPDKRYRVLQAFTDYYGGVFEAGTILTYVEQHFLPYDGGYTIVFKEATLYAQEEVNASFLDNLDTYIAEI